MIHFVYIIVCSFLKIITYSTYSFENKFKFGLIQLVVFKYKVKIVFNKYAIVPFNRIFPFGWSTISLMRLHQLLSFLIDHLYNISNYFKLNYKLCHSLQADELDNLWWTINPLTKFLSMWKRKTIFPQV